MKFLKESDVRPFEEDHVFKESSRIRLIGLLGLFLVSVASFSLASRGGIRSGSLDLPPFVLIWVGVTLSLLSILWFVPWYRTTLPGNWILRVRSKTLFIKCRSYLNKGDPSDIIVLQLNSDEGEWARAFHETRIWLRERQFREAKATWSFLELKPASHVDVAFLKEVLDKERSVKPQGGFTRGRFLHFPVELTEDGLLRICWRSPQTRVVPPLPKALKILSAIVEIKEEEAKELRVDHPLKSSLRERV